MNFADMKMIKNVIPMNVVKAPEKPFIFLELDSLKTIRKLHLNRLFEFPF